VDENLPRSPGQPVSRTSRGRLEPEEARGTPVERDFTSVHPCSLAAQRPRSGVLGCSFAPRIQGGGLL
jgi:hypothetical protein